MSALGANVSSFYTLSSGRLKVLGVKQIYENMFDTLHDQCLSYFKRDKFYVEDEKIRGRLMFLLIESFVNVCSNH